MAETRVRATTKALGIRAYRGVVVQETWDPEGHKWGRKKVIAECVHVRLNRDSSSYTSGRGAVLDAQLLVHSVPAVQP